MTESSDYDPNCLHCHLSQAAAQFFVTRPLGDTNYLANCFMRCLAEAVAGCEDVEPYMVVRTRVLAELGAEIDAARKEFLEMVMS